MVRGITLKELKHIQDYNLTLTIWQEMFIRKFFSVPQRIPIALLIKTTITQICTQGEKNNGKNS